MGHGIVVKNTQLPYGTRTHNLYGTNSPSNAGRARYPLHHLAIPQKKDGLRVSLSVHPPCITRGCEDNSQPVIQQVLNWPAPFLY